MELSKWPKTLTPLTLEQQTISDDFVKYWHEILASHSRYRYMEKFNHRYVIKHAPIHFKSTLEIGAGIGEHLKYERLTKEQKQNYIAVEIRENMAAQIHARYPEIQIHIGDCQQTLPFPDHYFDRILAIHVLEHLPDLPSTIKEMFRLCNKSKGYFSIVIPCEGGLAYKVGRKFSAEKLFKRRYNQPYQWFIEREHINLPHEILKELNIYFEIIHTSYFPLFVPLVNLNLAIGLTLRPKKL